MRCKYCNTEMYLDDKDRADRNTVVKYFNCPSCDGSCTVEYRYGFMIKQNWHSDDHNDDELIYL